MKKRLLANPLAPSSWLAAVLALLPVMLCASEAAAQDAAGRTSLNEQKELGHVDRFAS